MLDLANAWHARCVADPVVSHAFSHGFHPEHTERLAAYWSEALGGPSLYSEAMGDESTVIRLHSCNGEHQEMDDRAIDCFVHALADVGLSNDLRLRSALEEYFRFATATMASHPHSADDIPADLGVAKWSWGGPL